MNTNTIQIKDGPAFLKMRPRDRVKAHMRALISDPLIRQGGRLPTIQQVASGLKVSASTVQSVFREMSANGEIRTQVGNGTFLAGDRLAKEAYHIAFSSPMPSNDPVERWVYEICMGILAQIHESSVRIDLVTMPKAIHGTQDDLRVLLDMRAKVDGLILFPIPSKREVYEAYELFGKPVVNVNPPDEQATANFVSADFFAATVRIGRALRRGGRRRVVYLASYFTRSVSTRLRWYGLQVGCGFDEDRSGECRFISCANQFEQSGYETVVDLLRKKKWPPDAICCAGDDIALGAIRALREAGLAIPKDVSVIGGMGRDLSSTAEPRLTRMRQPLDAVGRELLRMLLQRIEQPQASVPGKFLDSSFIGGATTRADENQALGVAPSK